MSYILDALKKAEAERDPDARLALAADAQERRRHRVLLYLVLGALLVNAGVLAYLFTPTLAESSRSPTARPAAAAPPYSTPDHTADAAAHARPSSTAGTEENTPPGAAVTAAPPPRRAAAQRLDLAELPAASRSRFPELSFSTHLYASDASLRAVVVNGQRLQEGDHLGPLTLRAITEDGAVFGFEDYLVNVPVLDDWD